MKKLCKNNYSNKKLTNLKYNKSNNRRNNKINKQNGNNKLLQMKKNYNKYKKMLMIIKN